MNDITLSPGEHMTPDLYLVLYFGFIYPFSMMSIITCPSTFIRHARQCARVCASARARAWGVYIMMSIMLFLIPGIIQSQVFQSVTNNLPNEHHVFSRR
jgi:hypothetical protein